MSPKVPQAYLDARRDEIITAAFNCFATKGFHNTVMQDIYEATGLSPGAVYNYFSSKQEIAVATVKKLDTVIIPELEILDSDKPEESLQKMIDYWLSHLKQDYINDSVSIQLEYYSEATRNNQIREALKESMAAIHPILVEIIRRNQESGFIDPELDALSIVRAFIGMIFGIAMNQLVDPEVDVEAYSRVFKAMLTGTFTNSPEKQS